MKTKQWFGLSAVFAFISFISFANVDSAFGDEHNVNDVFMAAGIVGAVAAIASMYKAYQSSFK
jgi:hypothetical protein